MMKIELLNVKYHDRIVGMLSLTPDNKLCVYSFISLSPIDSEHQNWIDI